MSKPTRGFVPPTTPQRSTIAARPSPRRAALPSLPPRLSQTIPEGSVESAEAQQAGEAARTRTLWDTIIRRKKLVYAIGFGVVVVAGSILGARLKETRQEYARRKELDEAAKRLAESTVAGELKAVPSGVTTTTGERDDTHAIASTLGAVPRGRAYDVDVARQITLLEDRKALLNRQKGIVEQKIVRLRERTARRQEMEARRPQPVQVNK